MLGAIAWQVGTLQRKVHHTVRYMPSIGVRGEIEWSTPPRGRSIQKAKQMLRIFVETSLDFRGEKSGVENEAHQISTMPQQQTI